MKAFFGCLSRLKSCYYFGHNFIVKDVHGIFKYLSMIQSIIFGESYIGNRGEKLTMRM